MNEKLREYLAAHYGHRVLGSKIDPDALLRESVKDGEFLKAALSYRQSLEVMAGGCDLSKRDFAAYQALQALRRIEDATVTGQ